LIYLSTRWRFISVCGTINAGKSVIHICEGEK
jgi:hypothetical protein